MKKKLPDAKNPTIEAAISGLFKFASEASAKKKIELIRSNFVVSKTQSITPNPSVRLWIKNFEITEAETEKGYKGNFAIITYAKNENGKYQLYATKDEVELGFHPDKERPKLKHPNWNHKILKSALQKRSYANIADASNALESLFEEFPDITIPGKNKLFIMVYEKTDDKTPPVKKYLLEIKQKTDGTCIIEASENIRKPKQAVPVISKQEKPKPEELGQFTKMVIMRRAKKKRK